MERILYFSNILYKLSRNSDNSALWELKLNARMLVTIHIANAANSIMQHDYTRLLHGYCSYERIRGSSTLHLLVARSNSVQSPKALLVK